MTDSPAWRQSTYSEIQRYYNEEFPGLIDDLPSWITPNGPQQYALAFREKFPEAGGLPPKDFIRRHTRHKSNTEIYIKSWDEVLQLLQQPAAKDPKAETNSDGDRTTGLSRPSEVAQPSPVPAAAYYSLDHWDQFWVLAFDIDAKDVAKQSIAGGEQTYEDVSAEQVERSGIINEPPEPHTLPSEAATGSSDGDDRVVEYEYRFQDIETALHQAFDLKEWLEDTVGFDDVRVFYTGQGAHIYAFKDDPYYRFTHQTRRFLTTYIRERLRIPIDAAITWDRNRVMRLPFSLHTDVNRVVTEIESPDFDFLSEPVASTNTDTSGGNYE